MTSARRFRLLVLCAVVIGVAATATTVAVAQTDVQITSVTVSPNETVTGEPVTVRTTVTNLQSSSGTVTITDIYLRARGSTEGHGRIEDVGSVSPGGSVTVPLTTTFDEPGQKRLTAHVVVRDQQGDHQSYEYPVYVEVEEPVVRADLSARRAGNQSGTMEVALTNFGNTDLTDVEVTASANGEQFDRTYVRDVAPDASQTATFDVENVSADAVTFTATYSAAGSEHSTTRRVALDTVRQVEGEIRLTGVEATRTGSQVRIEGDAANVGSTDAESVLLSIPDRDGVSPVSPDGEYFVGRVEASEFATFELTGEVERGTASVPVDITYVVDGERVNATQRIEVGSAGGGGGQVDGEDRTPAAEPGGQQGGNGSGGLPLTAVGAVLALAVVGVAVFLWRR